MKKSCFLVIIVFLIIAVHLEAADEIDSPFAGKWYSSNKEFLQLQIEQYLKKATPAISGEVMALILPHAGYMYSGQTAAWGVKTLAGKKYSRVIIIGPSHYVMMHNTFSVPDVKRYKTPLGTVDVDTDFIGKMKKFHGYSEQDFAAHFNEHSVQMEIPFLQSVLTDFKIVPVILGNLDLLVLQGIASELRPLLDKDTLVVISSDFTHYGDNYGYIPFPVDDKTEQNLKDLDMRIVRYIENKDMSGFCDFMAETRETICGTCGIELLLLMLPPDAKPVFLHYDTSGRLSGDFNNSVSYLAFAFIGVWGKPQEAQITEKKDAVGVSGLSGEEKDSLLSLARKTIEFYLDHGRAPTADDLGIKITGAMKENRGVFVTLKENGELRGCIGEIMPVRPLYEAVIRQALNSAFADRRFMPVSKLEFPTLSYEISVLTPPKKIKSWKEIVIGRDGVIIDKDGYSAVFLPQVAPEQGWNVEQMLSNLSRKAGLPSDAWKEGAGFEVFQADVFDMETDAPLK